MQPASMGLVAVGRCLTAVVGFFLPNLARKILDGARKGGAAEFGQKKPIFGPD